MNVTKSVRKVTENSIFRSREEGASSLFIRIMEADRPVKFVRSLILGGFTSPENYRFLRRIFNRLVSVNIRPRSK